jgi:ABC-type Fe3+/spermidine/putrescine transport system ATPase subunit
MGCNLKVITDNAGSFYINQEIILGIRPEYIRITRELEENVLPGKVIHKMDGIASSNYRFHINSDTSEKRYLEATISKSGVAPITEGQDCYLHLPPELLVIIAE